MVRRRDGATVAVEAWVRRLDLPTGTVSIGVMRDMSARLEQDRTRAEFVASVSHDLKNPISAIKG